MNMVLWKAPWKCAYFVLLFLLCKTVEDSTCMVMGSFMDNGSGDAKVECNGH